MKKNVFINGRFLTQPLTGVQRYCRELVISLDRQIQEDQDTSPRLSWTLLCPEGADVDLSLGAIRTITVRGGHGQIWEQGALAYAARNGFLVSLGNSGPLCHPRHFVVIHDASVFRAKENYGWRFAISRRMLALLLARTAYIGTVSQFSCQELAVLLNLKQSSITVIPNGTDHIVNRAPDRSILHRLNLSGQKYLLCVGSLSINKNLHRAVKAFELVNSDSAKMVIAGGIDKNVYRTMIPQVSENILLTGRITDEELVALYQNAAALVFPSVYEGFGIPPLEAMAHRCLVLASDIAPVREVCADAALYFNPFDISEMAAKFRAALDGTLCRTRLIAKGQQRISLYNWRSSSQILRQKINTLAGC